MKVLILIIASGNLPVYTELEKLWRLYMHSDPGHIESYFIKAGKETRLTKDTIWTKGEENPSPGILNKTILSMEALLPRLSEFDYVLRTNLSSFYVFPRLRRHLETLPKTRCYAGVPYPLFASGAGFILSPDLVEILLDHKPLLIDNFVSADDVIIGCLLASLGIKILPTPRHDIHTLSELSHLPHDHFHFRIKNKNPERRMQEDLPIYQELVRLFYL